MKGWQLSSDSEPSVVARRWAKTSDEAVLLAMRCRLLQFHAGMVDVKRQGPAPSLGSV